NTGSTLRGMDLALASGVLAAKSIKEAAKKDFSSEVCLNHYQQILKKSFIINQMKRYKKTPDLLALQRLYNRYPQRMVQLTQEMFLVNSEGKSTSFGKMVRKLIFKVFGWRGLRDIWRLIRMGS
ncbi:MAG: hypothetical protein KAS65_08775, partial [Candidatus Aminicenantes bacterium]|nr:hypothetical protein [Candidatus Aminicenantes bacterium]